MKTILVPTDFSDVSENATRYAAELALNIKAKLILFHVYSVPVPVSDVPVVMIPIEEVEKESMDMLASFDKKLKSKYPAVETELLTKAGFVVDEILLTLEERKTDFVVMGVTGAGKSPGIFGSNATAVMKKAKTPILTIPPGMKFTKPERIALACDYSATVPDEVINKFKDFVRLFNAKVLVFDVLKPAELVSYQKAATEVNLENSLTDIEHSLYFPSGEDLPLEVNNFVERNNVEILAMVPHNYTFLQRLFHRSSTKKMAFQTKVPLLSIHE